MQTFLPYPNLHKSAMVLDRARLGKQRVEAKQLLLGQWPNHPASKMWRGYEPALAVYGRLCCVVWKQRGYADSLQRFFEEQLLELGDVVAPSWLGDDKVHASHRANLLRKDPDYYSQFGWSEEPTEGYHWPV